jgi:hypothetical protein
MKDRLGYLFFGILAIVIGVALSVFINRIFSPPAFELVYAVTEISPGEILVPDLVGVKDVHIDDPSPYITRDEVNEIYAYAPVVAQIYTGQLLTKSSLSVEGNPEAVTRISLAINDPGRVAMVIPVSVQNAPGRLVVGDLVDITISVGSATFLSGAFEAVPTTEPYDTSQLYFGIAPGPQEGLLPDSTGAAFITPVPTPTPIDPIHLPVSKTLVVAAPVLEVSYEQQFNPASSADPDAPAFIDGELVSIAVSVPRQVQEALAFAINNGAVQVAVRDPLASGEDIITAGISWDDLVEYYKLHQALWALTPQPQDGVIYPSGAKVLVETLRPTYFPELTPDMSLQGTPSAEVFAEDPVAVSPTPTPTLAP